MIKYLLIYIGLISLGTITTKQVTIATKLLGRATSHNLVIQIEVVNSSDTTLEVEKEDELILIMML